MPDLAPGARVGRWTIEGRLGSGGQAVTWRARADDGAEVALKHVSLATAAEWKSVELFEREAAALRGLEHPAIPRFVEAFTGGGDHPTDFFLAQELIEGRSLAQLMSDGASWSEDQLCDLAASVLDVLGWLHARNPPVIHRDLKPSNLIIRPDGAVALIDFGAVQRQLSARPGGGSTVVGTHGYMAPEQLMGRAQPSSDLYALGATLIHLASGRHPGDMPTDGLELDFEALTPLSPRVETWLGTLVAADPRRRPASAREASDGLRRARGPEPPAAPRPESRPPSKHTARALIVSIVLLVGAGAALGILLNEGEPPADVSASTSVAPDPRYAGTSDPETSSPFVELPTTFDAQSYPELRLEVRRSMLRKAEAGMPMSSYELRAVVTNDGDVAVREAHAFVDLLSFQKQTRLKWALVDPVHAPLDPGESRVVRHSRIHVPNDAERVEIRIREAPKTVELPPSEPRQLVVADLPDAPDLAGVSLWERRSETGLPRCRRDKRCFDVELRGASTDWKWLELVPTCVGPGDQRRKTHNDRDFLVGTHVLGRPATVAGDRYVFRVFCPTDATSVEWQLKKLTP